MTYADPKADIATDGSLHAGSADPTRQEGFLPNAGRQVHASFLLQLKNGDLACAWFGGSEEGKPDVSIYFSLLPKGSDQWTPETKVSEDPGRSEQNPVLFETPAGELWLMYTAQDVSQENSIVRRRISTDGGKSWGSIELMFNEPGIFIRQQVVVLENGDWLLPVFHCRPIPGEVWHGHNDISAVKISTDQGKSWTEYGVPESLGAVHMNVIELGGGHLLGLYRSRYADFIYQSVSEDNGRTWTAPVPTDLPNNNSSIQARRLSDGTIALVYNNISGIEAPPQGEGSYDRVNGATPAPGEKSTETAPPKRALWGIPRSPLTIAISSDNGKTWPVRRDIQVGNSTPLRIDTPKDERRGRELSYPTITETADGRIAVAFTYFRRGIKFVRFPKAWVKA